jgi:PilZ domain-containing protein
VRETVNTMLAIDDAVELLLQRPEVRIHTDQGVTLVLAGPQRRDFDSFAGLAPRLRVSPEQLWHARLTHDGRPYSATIQLTGSQPHEQGAMVTALILDVSHATERRGERVAVGVPVKISVTQSAFRLPELIDGTMLNLSEDGAELTTDSPLQAGDRLSVGARILGHRLEARSMVTYAYQHGGNGGTTLGVFFLDDRRSVTDPLVAEIAAAREAGADLAAQAPADDRPRRWWSLRRSEQTG